MRVGRVALGVGVVGGAAGVHSGHWPLAVAGVCLVIVMLFTALVLERRERRREALVEQRVDLAKTPDVVSDSSGHRQ
jgi:hypothetical protein